MVVPWLIYSAIDGELRLALRGAVLVVVLALEAPASASIVRNGAFAVT